MDENLKKYIDSLYEKAEATSSWPGSVWHVDHETLATAYRLCKDNDYYPEWFSKLCWNYETRIVLPGREDDLDIKRLEIASLGLEHCPTDDDMSKDFLSGTQKSLNTKSEEKAGIDPSAVRKIEGLTEVLALNLDLTDVLIRGFGWIDENYGYRKQNYYFIKTKIRVMDSDDSYLIEWRFSSQMVKASLDELRFEDKKQNLLITVDNGNVRFRLFPDHSGWGQKYTVDISPCHPVHVVASIEKVATFGYHEPGTPVGDEELKMFIKRLSDGLKAGTLSEARYFSWEDVIASLKKGKDLRPQLYECEHCKGKVYAMDSYYFRSKLLHVDAVEAGGLFICSECLEQLAFWPIVY